MLAVAQSMGAILSADCVALRVREGGCYPVSASRCNACSEAAECKLARKGSEWACMAMQAVGLDPSVIRDITYNAALQYLIICLWQARATPT